MTEKVILKNEFECTLQLKGEHIDLGESLKEYIRTHFIDWCNNHNYHPSTAIISVKKENDLFDIKMHIHLNHHDYHSHGENTDAYKAVSEAFHMLQHNVSRAR